VGIHAVEQEGLRIGLVGEPPRERERRMQMAVDEAGRRDGAAAVDLCSTGKALGYLSGLVDGDDLALVHGDRRIADNAALRVDGDQPIDIGDDEIDGLHVGLHLCRPSLPGSTRQSILLRKKMDARVKPAHDEEGTGGYLFSPTQGRAARELESATTSSAVQTPHNT